MIYVLERPATGPAKRIPANDLANYLNQPAQKQQITSQLNVENVLAKVGWSNEQLKEYLDKAPAGGFLIARHQSSDVYLLLYH